MTFLNLVINCHGTSRGGWGGWVFYCSFDKRNTTYWITQQFLKVSSATILRFVTRYGKKCFAVCQKDYSEILLDKITD